MKLMDPIALFKNILIQQNRTSDTLRLLGLYFGAKRVGIALADVETGTGPATDFCVMERRESNIMATEFRRLIRTLDVRGLIVGLPTNKQYELPWRNPEAYQVEAFVGDLSKTRILDKVEYTLWENSFGDLKGVESLLDAFHLDPMGAIQVKDGLIAKGTTKMLQDYLDTARGIMQIRDK